MSASTSEGAVGRHGRSPARSLAAAEKTAEVPPFAVVLTGTNPKPVRGGIGTAIDGYRHALIERGCFGGLVPTFQAGSFRGKLWPWLCAIPALRQTIRRLGSDGKAVVVYGHAGPRVSLVRESLILLWARLCGARTMLQLHTPHMDRYMDKPYVRFLLRLAFRPVDRVTVLSPWWQTRLAAGGFDDTVVVPNPLSVELERVARAAEAERRRRTSADGGEPRLVVLAMARLTRGKGVNLAIEALEFLPAQVVLRVAGDGPERTPLEALAQELGVAGRVEFLGWVSGAEKHRHLAEADVFCAPSRADAFSMSMIEALTHGLPVVTVRSKAAADLVRDGETGFVVEPNDAEAVAAAIMELAVPSTRAAMAAAAPAWVLAELSGKVVGARIEAAAAELLAHHRSARGSRTAP